MKGTFVYWNIMARNAAARIAMELRRFADDEEGVGVIEVVLILVVLIGGQMKN